MRTIRRKSLPLNKGKASTIIKIIEAFTNEKKHWLQFFISAVCSIKSHRSVRDLYVKSGYTSQYELQARMWKLALAEAAEMMDRYWKALFPKLNKLIKKNNNLTEVQKRYCHWILLDYNRMHEFLLHKYPIPSNFEINIKSIVKAGNYLNRIIKRHRGKFPCIKKAVSFVLDANCYKIFENNGKQYISIMTLERGKRLVIPLSGNTPIKGNIRIVLYGNQIEVHYTADLKPEKINNDNIEAVDFGFTEVITDSENGRYGIDFGKKMSGYSDKLNLKMKQRNKIYALQKKKFLKVKNTQKKVKVKNMQKYNLGRIKQKRSSEKSKAGIKQEVDMGLNQFYDKKSPKILITEDLRHLFGFGKVKSLNRKLSSWIKGYLQDRIAFKALARGSCHEQVNPAYGSQTCIACGFVWKGNRIADKFKCGFCKHEDYADRVAALNYKSRYGDKEITRDTPFREVKTILDGRFHRRLETFKGTVPGRTSETISVAIHTATDNNFREALQAVYT